MIEKALNSIAGNLIEKVDISEYGDISMYFSNGFMLSIYNKVESNQKNIHELSNKKIQSWLLVEGEFLKINFNAGTYIKILLDENSYNSPEALQISNEDFFLVMN